MDQPQSSQETLQCNIWFGILVEEVVVTALFFWLRGACEVLVCR